MRIFSYNQLAEIIRVLQLKMGLSGRVDFIETYRGQSLDTYKLEPGIGRYKYRKCTLQKKERILYKRFINCVKTGKIPFIQELPQTKKYKFRKEWSYFFQAQHLGLKTRLMDWSTNWEIALMFAVNEEKYNGKDGQFWIFICPRKYHIYSENLEKLYNTYPLKIAETYLINSPFYDYNDGKDCVPEKRRSRQHGRFLVQPFNQAIIPLEEQPVFKPQLIKYIIDGSSKEQIRDELGSITADWAYYRHNDNIDEVVKSLNEIITKKYFWE